MNNPMTTNTGSFRYKFTEKSKERLLQKDFSELGFGNLDGSDGRRCLFFTSPGEYMEKTWETVKDLAIKAWHFGRSDPRKVIFAAKMGLALVLISLLIFLKEPFKDLSRYSVWAILTVVVVFEFSIGTVDSTIC